jgi:hypothetical protein
MRVIYWRLVISGTLFAAIALAAYETRGHGPAHAPIARSQAIR